MAHDEPSDTASPLEVALTAVRLYAETHPRPTHVTKAEAARMLGLSGPTFRKMVRNGGLRLNAAGRVPIEEVDRARSAQAL